MKLTLMMVMSFILFSCNGNKKMVDDNLNDSKELLSINGEWKVIELDNKSISEDNVTITFTDQKIGGKAHCNSYFSSFKETKDGVSVQPIGATRRACPELNKEQEYFEKLQLVVKKEVVFNQPNYTLNLYDAKNNIVIKAKKLPVLEKKE